jgi:hypothetical protein
VLPAPSTWAPRDAVADLGKRLERFETVLGVGFGALEDERERTTGEAGLLVFVDPRLAREVDQVRKLTAGLRVGGHAIGIRAPRVTAEAYHDFLRRNGVRDPARVDCLPDLLWLDPGKIHRLVARRTRRAAARAPGDPATAVFGEIFVIEDDGTLVADPGDPAHQAVDHQAIFNHFRQQFGDHYDFMFVFRDGPLGQGAWGPTIFNDVSGINHYKGDAYDGRAGWNTTKLQAYQTVSTLQLRRMLHETAHRWLAYANHLEGGAASTNLHQDLATTDPANAIFHWGNWCDDERSCMDYDYFDWVDVAGGYGRDPLTAGSAAVDEFTYFGLDLYLMGLLTPGDTPGFRYLEDPQDPGASGVYTATPHGLTVADVVAAHGPRVPDAATSPRVFHQAFILLTQNLAGVGDLTGGLVQELDQWRRDFEQRFREATGSRAVIDTRLLHPGFGALYIRDNLADTGTGVTSGVTWDSPDIWVRQADDSGLVHQDTDRTHDNYLRARVWNAGAADYDDVTVRFSLGNHLENLPGTDFAYPEDWRQDRLLGAATITVPANGSAIAKITWHQAAIPPAAGWHPCLLVEVLPMEVTPVALHRRTQNRKLAQKNITIVGPPGDPEEDREFRFTVGRPSRWRELHVLVVERVTDVPGLEIALAAEAGLPELLPGLSAPARPGAGDQPPASRLEPPRTAGAAGGQGSRIYIPEGTWVAWSPGHEAAWTTIRFASPATVEIGAGPVLASGVPGRLAVDGVTYHVLPAWYRTALRLAPLRDRPVHVVRARVRQAGASGPRAPGGARLRFMEYDPDGALLGGVDYLIAPER